MADGVCRFKLRPKHHYLEETMLQMKRNRVNPRLLSCWMDESYLGHIKKLAIHAHAGNVLLRLFERLMINLSQKFQKTKQLAKQLETFGCQTPAPLPTLDSLPV